MTRQMEATSSCSSGQPRWPDGWLQFLLLVQCAYDDTLLTLPVPSKVMETLHFDLTACKYKALLSTSGRIFSSLAP
ncbi:hypothetical protein E2C01_025956 [Portunus trituberculatus]|uniref:Uncharacterized protein n=1 Tax=Portunus trituberculatus TaxID=210409 RepID=A0A5B7EJD0_PORTR|nr:hypothetical protein [Portunus trituberculatus]